MNKFKVIKKYYDTIPGLAVIITGVMTPPSPEIKYLFGGFLEAFGIISLAYFYWRKKGKIKDKEKARIARYAIIIAAFSFLFLGIYLCLFEYCVVTYNKNTVYYPLVLTGELKGKIEKHGRAKAINDYGKDLLENKIKDMPHSYILKTLTTLLFLLLYLGIFLPLSVAFGILGFYVYDEPSLES